MVSHSIAVSEYDIVIACENNNKITVFGDTTKALMLHVHFTYITLQLHNICAFSWCT